MAITIIDEPGNLNFSRNEFAFRINNTLDTDYRARIEIDGVDNDESFQGSPNTDDTIVFEEASNFFDSRLVFELPGFVDNYTHFANMFGFGDGLFEDGVSAPVQSPQRMVIKGRITRKDYLNDSFGANIITLWLSYAPKKKLLGTSQKEIQYFYWSYFLANAAPFVYLKIDGGAAIEYDYYGAGVTKPVMAINLSYAKLEVYAGQNLDNAKVIEVYLENPTIGAQSKSESIFYYMDRKTRKYERQYLFQNQMGGFEVLRTTGKRTDENSFERTIAEKYQVFDAPMTEGEREVWDVEIMRSFQQFSGIFEQDAKAWASFLKKEFFQSEEVYEIDSEGELIPVLIEDKKTSEQLDSKDIRFISFTAMYANRDA